MLHAARHLGALEEGRYDLIHQPLRKGYYRDEYAWEGECPRCGAGEECLSPELHGKGMSTGFRVRCVKCGYWDCSHHRGEHNMTMHSSEGRWSALDSHGLSHRRLPKEIAECHLRLLSAFLSAVSGEARCDA